MNIRENREELEKLFISGNGMLAVNSKGRETPEDECDIRTCFQRDIDRITYSKAFRRLKHKTQVYLHPEGDHYRTRLSHTLEVTRIARTISRALRLNEDLTEAIALGHDLGHTPFGHAGERALAVLMDGHGGFTHYDQSLRVVDRLEKDGRGLNLTYEVRNGIERHTCDPLADTLEGQIVRLADKVAYINHDADDAFRAGTLREEDLPESITSVLGGRYSKRIDTITKDIIKNSFGKKELSMSKEISDVVDVFHDYLFESVYRNPEVKSEERKVYGLLEGLFEHYLKNPNELPKEYALIAEKDGLHRAVSDYVSGMTDPYALYVHDQIYVPTAWLMR